MLRACTKQNLYQTLSTFSELLPNTAIHFLQNLYQAIQTFPDINFKKILHSFIRVHINLYRHFQ